MAERKVLNKYFPPDFDPSLIPRRKLPKNAQQVVRLMAPFSMRCNTCGEYIYKGKKFNARKETVEGEDYYGIKIFRFYIKCTLCSAEITFKTDPKNTDYAAEHGASRNFEPWREEGAVEEQDRLTKLEEEENNPMKALENRTTDSKREMDILDALQDIRARNARNERMGHSIDLLADIGVEELENEEDRERKLLEEEDEKLVRDVFSKVSVPARPRMIDSSSGSGSDQADAPITVTVKRKADDIEPSLHSLLPESARTSDMGKVAPTLAKRKKLEMRNSLGIKVSKGKVDECKPNSSKSTSSPFNAMDSLREDPRISVETVQQWQRTRSNYAKALLESLEARLHVQGLTKDKNLYLSDLNQHIGNVFKMAQPNLRVNGQNFEELAGNDEGMEPFDEGLDRHIWSLSDQRLKWDLEIGRTRAEKPKEAEGMVHDLIERQHETSLEDGVNNEEAHDGIAGEFNEEQIPQGEYIFQNTVATSKELNQAVPVQHERSTHIEKVVKEVKRMKP